MPAHCIALPDEHLIEVRERGVRQGAVWLSKKRGATPVRDAADARSSRTKAR
ncbi:MAG: hypothetical protein CBARDMAM_1912 [uncultured Caballeronia sp.]|nr:MAG: hypothetical protein CBARDMAM_1912 [uncultured Caballeronia sp.]